MEYTVDFIHPTTGARLTAQINPEFTVDEVINALVGENFISPPDPNRNYGLGIDGSGEKLVGNQTLASGGLRDGSVVNVIELPHAG